MGRRSPLRFVRAPLLGILVLGCVVSAQETEERIESDLEYARELVSRFGYADLAEEILEGLERAGIPAEFTDDLALVRCRIRLLAAQRAKKTSRKLELYEEAFSAYEELLDGEPDWRVDRQAVGEYLDAVIVYARLTELMLGLAEEDEAEDLRQRMSWVLVSGLEETGIRGGGKGPTPEEKIEQARRRLQRAEMLIVFAKVSQAGTFMLAQADNILEDLDPPTGEMSGWRLNLYILLAESKLAQGDHAYAADFGEYVFELMVPSTEKMRAEIGWDSIPIDYKARRWDIVERVTGDLLRSLVALGDMGKACEWALHFHDSWKRDGFTLSPDGHLALLEVSRALLESGGWVGGRIGQEDLRWFETEEAMHEAGFAGARSTRRAVDLAFSLALHVDRENRGNLLQRYAQRHLTEIRDRTDVVLAPEVLFDIARAEYEAGRYPQAREALKDVLRAIGPDDEATKRFLVPRVLYYLGQTLQGMERPLEAAMVFREAVTTWRGDPEYDGRNARSFYEAMRGIRHAAPDDERIRRLGHEAEEIVVSVPSAAVDDVKWYQGERLFAEGRYEEARAKCLEVGEEHVNHERALVKAALCLYKLSDVEGARAEFVRYIQEIVPRLSALPTSPEKDQARRMARAQAVFYLGRIAWSKADYERVVELYTDFERRFPKQTSYAPNALQMLLRSHLGLGNGGEARTTLARLRETFPGDRVTGAAALHIYTLARTELAAAEREEDAEQVPALKREMADCLGLANEIDPEPGFANLRGESTLWIELEEWKRAEGVVRRTLEAFGDERSADIEKYVKPDLGLCLLRQKRLAEAFEVLDPLFPDPTDPEDMRKPSAEVTERWCRAVCGWLEGDAEEIVVVPGVGDAAALEKASERWLHLTNHERDRGLAWQKPWYERKLDLLYCWYRWGLVDSSRRESCRLLIADFRDYAGPLFEHVRDACEDEVLQRHFLWLWERVR